MSGVQIGELTFSTKARALEHFQMHRYELGAIVSEADARKLLWLLKRHPDCTQSAARIRTDLSSTDFSYRKCLTPPTILQRIIKVLRAEVQGEILQAKDAYFAKYGDAYGQVPCQLTGTLITIDEADADHAAPYTFHVLASTFLAARKLIPDEALLGPLEDNQWGRQLLDRRLAAEWCEFHHQHADLRIVCKREHRNRSQENRRRAVNRQLQLI